MFTYICIYIYIYILCRQNVIIRDNKENKLGDGVFVCKGRHIHYNKTLLLAIYAYVCINIYYKCAVTTYSERNVWQGITNEEHL